MSFIFGGLPLLGFGCSCGLYVAKDATTNRKISDTIFLGLTDIHFAGLITTPAACVLRATAGNRIGRLARI